MSASLLLLVACSAPPSTGALPLVEGEGFFDRPFPSMDRMVDGHPDLSDFPGQAEFPLVGAYADVAVELDGFGTNSPLWLRFVDPLDTSLLPTPEASMALDSPVLLLDVDRYSPHRGEAVPLAFEWTAEDTAWQPSNLLAAAPVFGFPLRPGTEYALILRSPLVRAGAQGDVWGIDGDDAYRPTEETLRGLGIDPATVSLAVPFRTQDPLAGTRRVARAIHDELGHAPFDDALVSLGSHGAYTLYEGHVTVPIWQHGERPYSSEGGGFVFDEDGAPVVYAWERVKFALSVPTHGEMGDGWPVVLYSHGTGGNHRTLASGSGEEEASVLGREGLAVLGISQPLHGDRAPHGASSSYDPSFDSFNYLNPEAGRANFRQGALDQVFLAHLLADGPVFTADDGATVAIDPDRVAFFGHSQGGIVGAMAAPFFDGEVRAAGFSGAGGGLSMTVLLRKDPLDIEQLLVEMLEFDEGEELTTFHPVVGLIQMLSEVTDPINYAPSWFADDLEGPGEPLPVLITEGLLDDFTPPATTEALAAAGRVPIVGPPQTAPEALRLRGLDPVALPTSDNAKDWAGAPITAGLGQFADVGHYAIYDVQEAKALYRDFLDSSLSGEPVLAD